MESPFDIAADLDTPVSAYMKLGPFKPRFLLESVESGERLARYSFIGLGEALTLELYPDRLKIDGKAEKRPASAAEWLAMMRGALERAPLLKPQIEDVPFDGGLVGTTGYDVVRFFERLPPNHAELKGLPQAVYVAPESMLVFDHLTRRVALLHAGSERERQALRSQVDQSAARRLRRARAARQVLAGRGQHGRARLRERGRQRQGAHQGRRHLSDRAVRALRGPHRPRSVPDLPRTAAAESVAIHVLLRARRHYASPGSSPEALVRLSGRTRELAADRRHAAARAHARARRRARDRAARGSEGERRARDARRPRAQRPRPGREPRARCTSIRTARSSATAT